MAAAIAADRERQESIEIAKLHLRTPSTFEEFKTWASEETVLDTLMRALGEDPALYLGLEYPSKDQRKQMRTEHAGDLRGERAQMRSMSPDEDDLRRIVETSAMIEVLEAPDRVGVTRELDAVPVQTKVQFKMSSTNKDQRFLYLLHINTFPDVKANHPSQTSVVFPNKFDGGNQLMRTDTDLFVPSQPSYLSFKPDMQSQREIFYLLNTSKPLEAEENVGVLPKNLQKLGLVTLPAIYEALRTAATGSGGNKLKVSMVKMEMFSIGFNELIGA